MTIACEVVTSRQEQFVILSRGSRNRTPTAFN